MNTVFPSSSSPGHSSAGDSQSVHFYWILGIHLFLITWFLQLFTGFPGIPLPGTQPPELSPEEVREHIERVQQSLKRGNYREALEPARTLHRVYPANSDYIQYLAQINDKLGKPRRSIRFWELLMDRSPDPQVACPRLGQLYQQQGQPQEAIRTHERCLELNPSNTDLILYLALAHEQQANYEQALPLYRRGLELAPQYHDHRLGLARIAFKEERLEEALNHVKKVLNSTNHYPSALVLAGKIHEQKGNTRRALEFYQQANEQGGSSSVSPERLRRLEGELR